MSGTLAGQRALVVGGGFGGLAAAAHLARRGAKVTVLEQAAEVGGKAGFLEEGGFSFDTGPTLLTMPDIVRETFAAAGTRFDDVVRLVSLDPVCRYLLPDGRGFFMHRDHGATERSLAEVLPEDARRWRAFFEECRSIWEVVGEVYLGAPYDGAVGFAQRLLKQGPRAFKLGTGFSTLDDLGRRAFASDAMRAVVGRFATYAGGDPARTSAAFAMVLYVEVAFGAHYPMGGMNALARALGRAVENAGVVIRRGARVTGLTFDGSGRATGARFESRAGAATVVESIPADLVVCDVDPRTVAERLVPEGMRTAALRGHEGRTPSLSGFAGVFGVEGEMPRAAHHNVLFPARYDAEFEAIFQRGKVADDPTVYVSIPSVTDPGRAPEGCHSVFCLVNAPATAAKDNWEVEAQRLRGVVAARLERHFAPGFAQRIRAERFVSPVDIARTGAAGGAIYGAAPHGPFGPFERPRNRADYAQGLYFVGGATHPGGGVPIVMRGGRFVADLAEQDAARRRPLASRFFERAS